MFIPVTRAARKKDFAMTDWVRYSVAVYAGLLMAGSLMTSRQASAGPSHWKPVVVQPDLLMNRPNNETAHPPNHGLERSTAQKPNEHHAGSTGAT